MELKKNGYVYDSDFCQFLPNVQRTKEVLMHYSGLKGCEFKCIITALKELMMDGEKKH